MDTPAVKETMVICRTNQGIEVRAGVVRLTRHLVVFELYDPHYLLQTSEVLNDFKILLNERIIYSGPALVSNLLNTGAAVLCEATLKEGWIDVQSASPGGEKQLRAEFGEFVQQWQKNYKVLPEFKLVVADMQSMLVEMRQWLEQVELGILAQPPGSQREFEREVIGELQKPILPMLGALFEKFEESCKQIEPELQPAHRAYVQRQLHPNVLCAPFMYRTFKKPLGYAGDYEMVNMMVRDPQEGSSLFAKVLNTFFLSTPPVVAHRNRIEYLKGILIQEVARVVRSGRKAKIFNLGCGPAREIQEFIAGSELCNHAQFTLVDFNEETLNFTGKIMEDLIRAGHRKTSVQRVKKSIARLLKEEGRPGSSLIPGGYDLVYCAGLFDYLPQFVCEQFVAISYNMLAPGGLLLVTNVDKSNPSRNWMEYCVDWHLVYRDHNLMAKLVPHQAPPDSHRILCEPSGVNIFMEIRKPNHV